MANCLFCGEWTGCGCNVGGGSSSGSSGGSSGGDSDTVSISGEDLSLWGGGM